jgi:uncharacterized protein YjbJ (UPF0337 family)
MADKDLNQQGAQDSLEGKGDQLKGHLKDAAGGLTGDTGMQAEGKWDQKKGKAKDAMGKIERDHGSNDDRNP